MELDQWLMVYLAIAQGVAAKERSGWSLFGGVLIAESVLAIGAVFLLSTEPVPRGGPLLFVQVGLVVIGLLSSLAWLASQVRVQAEASHLSALLRGIESQFAGGEFLRSLERLAKGERVCSSASQWTCGEWLPSVSRLPFAARLSPRFLAALVSFSFLCGWIALLVRAVAL